MKIEKSQGVCRLPAFAVLLLKWRPTWNKLASQNASIASDLGAWQTASCILGIGLCLKELLEEESPGSICSCHNCSLEYVKSQHLARYRHWSYDKQVLEYRKSQFAATVTLSRKNALQNARHPANCLLRPCEALCNNVQQNMPQTSSLWVPDKIVCVNAVNEMFVVLIKVLQITAGLSYDAARGKSCCCN